MTEKLHIVHVHVADMTCDREQLSRLFKTVFVIIDT